MRATSHAPFYDLFKLIVAIILLVIFLFLIWNRPTQPLQPIPPAATSTPPPPTPTIVSPTSTPVPPTTTLEPSETATQTATLTPPPTAAVTDEPLPTPIVEVSSDEEACTAYARSQLEVGMEATIQRRLNFRSFPGLFNNLILTNNPGTEVEIVGGPVCTRYQEGGAYLWWQIKLPDGLIGWSAEASAFGAFYFMEPTE
jgi:hypothetical protein